MEENSFVTKELVGLGNSTEKERVRGFKEDGMVRKHEAIMSKGAGIAS